MLTSAVWPGRAINVGAVAAALDLIRRWRETADIWDVQCEEYYPRNPDALVPSPPSRARKDIKNWINWLRAMANDVEALILVLPAPPPQETP